MNSKIPAYLYEKSNVFRLIIFTAIFALLFINIFQPFNSHNWYPNINDFKYFFFSSLIILTGMLVVVVSRMIMLKYVKRNNELLTYQLALHIFAEVLFMSLFFTIFAKFIARSPDEIVDIFVRSAKNTAWTLLLPYSALWLYFSWRDKTQKLNQLMSLQKEDSTAEVKKSPILAFTDEKGELKISIALDHILYVDSADNYITIHYLNKSKISQFLLRNSLKWMEENLAKDNALVRCHRSYIVNLDKVKVMRKTKDGIFLELDALNTPDIPVSKTFYPKVISKFSDYSV